MSDLIDDDAAETGGNAPEFTVTEISGAIKRTIEGEFSHIRVRGEIGRVSRPRSGHVYLDLKDDRSVLSGVIWKGVASRLTTPPEEGMEVIATGRLTTFGGQSKYQIVIEDIAPAGIGALMAMLEKRRQMLAAEGLFDPERKRALPYLPEVIGVVTSPSGAVIRDILHRLRDRFPRKVLVWPVAVQGQACAAQVTAAIEGFNRMTPGGALPRPDLLIVARGGGSIEDLWGFNEESVVRAAAASAIPLISAVGHETDTTLIDHAADRRAPTPTAAAEMAVPVRLELMATVTECEGRLSRAAARMIGDRGQRLRDLSRALPRPEMLVGQAQQRFDLWADRLPAALKASVQRRKLTLSDRAAALRPGLLRRQVAEARRSYESCALRLRPQLVDRGRMQASRDLALLSARLDQGFVQGVTVRRERLDAVERLRQTLGYQETLRRGYAVVRAGEEVVTTAARAREAGALEIEFADGRFRLGGAAPKPARKAPKGPDTPPEQGSLL
ncbi:exodeoxyribonuclease VII large subunit [Pacificitalea manganoxidans]|uniref:Exodeoxyribonuclease 7 large subunit n=1 Tax=Pacificitalea manganoxidans TaxID=1411902 RepID=A0A291LXK1_9RHOB|nr:exodeoxyribonuclease VII large subunit [Pacificitalea manganoxidans]ATI41421.1 exodeoxyribonuclease VII large subunit [Pacificitalea manganoxidans]MDR6308832.1 exodeoxyribonuclease VII large subunit [Pacificitalea manganoxidans]